MCNNNRIVPALSALAALAICGAAYGGEVERVDLLTFANGAVFVSQTGLATGSAGKALRVVDGDATRITLSSDKKGPVELVYKLPAPTTFDRFAVPAVAERAGNATFFKSVEILGSAQGAEAGFERLAGAELATHGPEQSVTEIVPDKKIPVRWIKVRLAGGILIEPDDVGRTNLEFTELIGNGVQEEQPFSEAFSGQWDFKYPERLDRRGTPLRLQQSGATITGCLGTVVINGSVNGRIARATGVDTRNERPSAFIFVDEENGSLQALMSVNRGRFDARTALPRTDAAPVECEAAAAEPDFCGTAVYVNFEVDSAEIRPESEQILADLYAGLSAAEVARVSIEGHTSTEGSDDYNRQLSERRARAVVADLVRRGFDAAKIEAIGKGESEPLFKPDRDETSRAMNRRVEIECAEGG